MWFHHWVEAKVGNPLLAHYYKRIMLKQTDMETKYTKMKTQ